MVASVQTRHWQLAPLGGDSDVLSDVDDINQCIINILATRKGTDVTRPTFGSDWFDYIDTPEDVFVPNVTREVYLAVQTWEKRAVMERVEFEGNAPHIAMSVYWHIAAEVAGEIYRTDIRL